MSGQPLSRVSDAVRHGGTCSEISKGSPKTKCEGKWVARVGDPNTHGNATIKTGALRVIEGGKPIARIGESSTCGGKIATGASRTIVGTPSTTTAPKLGKVKTGAGESVAPNPLALLGALGPAMMGGMGAMQALMGVAGAMMPMLGGLMKGGLGSILGLGMNQLMGAAGGMRGMMGGGAIGGLGSLAMSAMQMGAGPALSQLMSAITSGKGGGAPALTGGTGGAGGGSQSSAAMTAARALLAADAANQAHYGSDKVFDALLAHADANGGAARPSPDLAYASLPNDPEVVARVLEQGFGSGDALGRTPATSQGIVFGAGAPLQTSGLTLVVPSEKLVELGAVATTGQPGLGATLELPAGALSGPLPAGDFAVASALPRGYIEPISVPADHPTFEHGVGTTPPDALRPGGVA